MVLQVIKLEPVIMYSLPETPPLLTFLTLTPTRPITLHFMNIMEATEGYI